MAKLRSDLRWVAAITAPQREKWAAENIKRQHHEFYLPMCRERIVSKGKLADVEKPLFPRYLFVHVTIQWRFLTGTFGVIGIVLDGDTPAVFPDGVINEIKRSETNGALNLVPDEAIDALPRKDADIVVTEGTWSGFTGKFVGKSGEDRVRVLLSLFGRASSVEVMRNQFRVA